MLQSSLGGKLSPGSDSAPGYIGHLSVTTEAVL